VELLRGRAWVDPATFLVTRIEGEPAKNPSWWVKTVHLSIDYGRADGLWLPLETRATADLRLIGKHTLTSENVRVQAIAENAMLQPSKAASRTTKPPHSVAAAAVWVPR
jgi:hypothetical protein